MPIFLTCNKTPESAISTRGIPEVFEKGDVLTPIVSIVIPSFNRQEYIAYSLASIIGQSFQNWEAIVVDDGSTDKTTQIVEEWSKCEPRIRVIRRQRVPKGAPTCRNIGIEESRGRYLLFLDSDDLLGERCLETRYQVLEANNKADFCVGQSAPFYSNAGDLGKKLNCQSSRSDIDRFLRRDNPWDISGPLWRREFIENIRFDESLPSFQDWQFHMDALLNRPKYITINVIDHHYRSHLHRKDCISNISRDRAHIVLHGKLFCNVARKLRVKNLLNDERAQALCGLAFYCGTTAARLGAKAESREVWSEMTKVVGTGFLSRLLGLACIMTARVRYVRFLIRWGVERFLGNERLGTQSQTLGNTELQDSDYVDWPCTDHALL
jgi:glycosyltransferase involved in cell wall biosynthesis